MVRRLCENREGSPPGENLSLIPSLSLNQKTPGVKPHPCSACGKGFMHRSSLNRHIKCHTEPKPDECWKYGEKPYTCKEDGTAFSYLQVSEKHEGNHSGKEIYTCTEGGRAFMCLRGFQRHKVMHTGNVPHRCKECGKTFTSSDSLQIHERTHTRENPIRVYSVEEPIDPITIFKHI